LKYIVIDLQNKLKCQKIFKIMSNRNVFKSFCSKKANKNKLRDGNGKGCEKVFKKPLLG
jgi:hypothetical protein